MSINENQTFFQSTDIVPARARVSDHPRWGLCDPRTSEAALTRATGQFETTIPAQSIAPLGADSVSLSSGGVISYDCTYTPRDASVKFGYIGPDGLFYGLSGYKGSIDKGIRVNQSGTYTLAIWNKSDEAVSVWGTVNY